MESIVGGSIGTAEVKIAGFQFQNRTYDLCSTAMHHVGLKCPVAAGKYSVNMTTPIPIISPRVSTRVSSILHSLWYYVTLEACKRISACPPYTHDYRKSIIIILLQGQYTATARAMDPTGKELVCLNVAFEIKWSSKLHANRLYTTTLKFLLLSSFLFLVSNLMRWLLGEFAINNNIGYGETHIDFSGHPILFWSSQFQRKMYCST